jgi:hypothetical protein
LIRDRVENGGWAKEDPRFVPLLASLREVLPWVHQWYGEYDEEWEGNPAEEFQSALESGRTEREEDARATEEGRVKDAAAPKADPLTLRKRCMLCV